MNYITRKFRNTKYGNESMDLVTARVVEYCTCRCFGFSQKTEENHSLLFFFNHPFNLSSYFFSWSMV